MKKITRKRFTQSKGNKSFFGTVARFGAAIPLCLMMLGGLSFVSFDKAQAAVAVVGTTGSSGVAPVVPVDAPVTILDDLAVNNVTGGVGGAGAAGFNGGAGQSIVISDPSTTQGIIFNAGAGLGVGGAGQAAAVTAGNGGNAGSVTWSGTGNASALFLAGTMGAGGVGGAGAGAGTVAGNGGTGSALDINFTGNIDLTGNNAGDAANLIAGVGGDGGASGAISSGGLGGDGGSISLTAGGAFTTVNGNALFTGGAGGVGGALNANTDAGSGGNGGNGGGVTFTAGSVFVGTASSNAAPANNIFGFAAGDGGVGGDGQLAVGTGSGMAANGGAGGSVTVAVAGAVETGNFDFIAGDSAANGTTPTSFRDGMGGAGGNMDVTVGSLYAGESRGDVSLGDAQGVLASGSAFGGANGGNASLTVTNDQAGIWMAGPADGVANFIVASGDGFAGDDQYNGGNGGSVTLTTPRMQIDGDLDVVAGDGGSTAATLNHGGNGGDITIANKYYTQADNITLVAGDGAANGAASYDLNPTWSNGDFERGGNIDFNGGTSVDNNIAVSNNFIVMAGNNGNNVQSIDLNNDNSIVMAPIAVSNTYDGGVNGNVSVTMKDLTLGNYTENNIGSGFGNNDGWAFIASGLNQYDHTLGAATAVGNKIVGEGGDVNFQVTGVFSGRGLAVADSNSANNTPWVTGSTPENNLHQFMSDINVDIDTMDITKRDITTLRLDGTIDNYNTTIDANVTNGGKFVNGAINSDYDAQVRISNLVLGDATNGVSRTFEVTSRDTGAGDRYTNGTVLNSNSMFYDGVAAIDDFYVVGTNARFNGNVNHVRVFDYNFVLPSYLRPTHQGLGDNVLLTVNGATTWEPSNINGDRSNATTLGDRGVYLDGASVNIETPARLRNFHRDLGSFTLVSGVDHTYAASKADIDSRVGDRINSGIYRFVLEKNVYNDGTSSYDSTTYEGADLIARVDGIPGFNAYSEAQAARLAFVADGLNHIITSGIYEMSRATEGDEMGIRFFASGYGSKNRYSTGNQSHADIEGAGFLAGAGWATDTVDGQRLLVGAFMEGGWGSYDTHSSSHGAGFNADGATSYMGGGLMGKYTFPFGLYFDMSARIGNAKMDFSSDDLGTNGYENSFDSSNAMYYGGHIGGGYEWAIDEQQSLDFNTRLLWTHLNSDDVRSNYGDQVNFDSANSLRWRTGARYNYAFDLGTGGTLKPFVGVAYEHEFDGDAKTNVDGRRTERTASLSGGTAIGELGASWQATDNFSLELAGQGNVLTRQGGSGQLSLKWEF